MNVALNRYKLYTDTRLTKTQHTGYSIVRNSIGNTGTGQDTFMGLCLKFFPVTLQNRTIHNCLVSLARDKSCLSERINALSQNSTLRA